MQFYLDLRKKHHTADCAPVTTRQLESLIRLTEVYFFYNIVVIKDSIWFSHYFHILILHFIGRQEQSWNFERMPLSGTPLMLLRYFVTA